MKYILITLLILTTTITHSQNETKTIHFRFEGNEIKINEDLTKLKLPIDFEFTKDFKDTTINILNGSNEIIALKDGKFGKGHLTTVGEVYIIQIDKDGKVNPLTSGDKNIEGKTIKLKIGNTNPIVLSFDEGSSNDPINDKYQPGYIYYDAIKLSTEKDPKSIKDILEAYGLNSKNISSNPYLNEFFPEIFKVPTPESGFPLLENLGNTDVTNFSTGLARFLAERTKEELNEVFFSKMKEQLNAYPELITVFPKTSSFLNIIETYSYASVIQVLKEAFETDIQNLPENLYNIKSLTFANCNSSILKDSKLTDCQVRMDKLKKFFESQDGRWVGFGMFTVKEAIQSSNPADLLNSLTASTEFKGIKDFSKTNSKYANYNLASSIELSRYLSKSLRSMEDNQIWVNSIQLNVLLNDEKTIKIYLGLLVARGQKGDEMIDFYNSTNILVTFDSILITAYGSYSKYKSDIFSLIKNSYSAFNSANSAVKRMIAATDKSVEPDPQSLYNYYRTFTASLKPIAHSALLDSITKRKDIGAEYDKIELYLNSSVDMAYHISSKKYSAAIYDASILLSALDTFKISVDKKFLCMKVGTKNEMIFKPVTKSFVKYGTLISTVANAQSSEEVKQALDASVLPVGSYSIKRKTNWSMSINSYVGAYWSYSNTATNKDSLPRLGLAAPVGFNISKGFSKTGNCGGLSLNIQIIDVGALVNYYFLKGDTASIPNDFKVRLSNIFSPGLNISYNIPKTPLSFAWGGQYIPTLYKYEQINGKNEITPTNAWRWQISFLVDIPLFNLQVWDFKK